MKAADALFRAGVTPAEIERARLLDPLDQRVLLCHALGWSRVELITRDSTPLSAGQAARLQALFERRLAGEPVAYLVGEREFFGLRLAVGPGVLIPRPDTELLVELALARLPDRARVLDLGTGSGAIALAIAANRPQAQVTALDRSVAALEVARANAASLGLSNVDFIASDWYGALADVPPFDMLVSNPPYIVAGDAHLAQGDLRFEPIDALTDHADGLSAYRAIVGGVRAHLRPGGCLLLEHGYDQAAAVRALLEDAGMVDVESWRDLAGIERVSGARLPA